jgi:hypothetical protein
MLNKRIISAAAAVVVALGGFGAPVFGGVAQNFDIAASALSYTYADFRANAFERGATDRMMEELDKFFLENEDYFTAGDFQAFIEKTDELYTKVMAPACQKAYNQDPADLTDEERRDVLRNYVSASNKNKAFELIKAVGAEHGVDVSYKVENGVIIPICTLLKDTKPTKQYITVSPKRKNGEKVDLTKMTITITSGKNTYTQDADAKGKVEVTDLLKKGDTIQIALPGFAPRTFQYDGTTDLSTLALCHYGDLNGDGKIDLDDLQIMEKLVAGWDVDDQIIYKELYDIVNGDNKADLDDLQAMEKYVAGWDVPEFGVPVVQA